MGIDTQFRRLQLGGRARAGVGIRLRIEAAFLGGRKVVGAQQLIGYVAGSIL